MNNKEAFISQIAGAAQADMREYGILASVTIAQAILESGWGQSAPGNNLFGIKGSGQQLTTQEYINGKWVQIVDGFRVYTSWADSIRDHSLLLAGNARYRAVLLERDYKAACQALQSAGYATDPQYANKLIAIIDTNGLTGYDTCPEDDTKGETEVMMSAEDANKVIGFLSAAWQGTDNQEARDEFHRLANELRKVSGQEQQG